MNFACTTIGCGSPSSWNYFKPLAFRIARLLQTNPIPSGSGKGKRGRRTITYLCNNVDLAVLAHLGRTLELIATEGHPAGGTLDRPLHLLAWCPVIVHLQVPLPRATHNGKWGHPNNRSFVGQKFPDHARRIRRVGSDHGGGSRVEGGWVRGVCGAGASAHAPNGLPLGLHPVSGFVEPREELAAVEVMGDFDDDVLRETFRGELSWFDGLVGWLSERWMAKKQRVQTGIRAGTCGRVRGQGDCMSIDGGVCR